MDLATYILKIIICHAEGTIIFKDENKLGTYV